VEQFEEYGYSNSSIYKSKKVQSHIFHSREQILCLPRKESRNPKSRIENLEINFFSEKIFEKILIRDNESVTTVLGGSTSLLISLCCTRDVYRSSESCNLHKIGKCNVRKSGKIFHTVSIDRRIPS